MNLINNDEFAKLADDPYRTSVKPVEKKYIRTPEEVIQSLRSKIPGPIRRILAILLIVPVHVFSIVAAVFIVAPILYIATGKWSCWFDSYNDSEAPRLCLRGTYALFFDYDYHDLRYLRRRNGLPPPNDGA